VVQPKEIIPGVANYYATTIANGYDFASVLVKTREGRPIKIENNNLAETNGMANARVHASVLDLYDNKRVKTPLKDGQPIGWSQFVTETNAKLEELKAAGKEIVVLTQSYASPSTRNLIADFREQYTNVRHVTYDAVSESAALDAFQAKYGERALANYDFEKAMTIVSVGADFLGDWQGGGFDSGYAKKRVPQNGQMSKHIQFESNMSLTGANADVRVPLKPSEQRLALAKLYSYVTGANVSGSLPEALDKAVRSAASALKKAGSNAVVVTGIQDVNAQTVALQLNEYLNSKAFDPKTSIKIKRGNDTEVATLVADMKAGKIAAIIMAGVNPIYTLPNAEDFKAGLEKVELSIASTMKVDETAKMCSYVAAAPHYLESWGDVEMKKGHYSLMQPTIRPLFDTKQFQELLMAWTANEQSYDEYIKMIWTQDILGGASFGQALHDGVFKVGYDAVDTLDDIENTLNNDEVEAPSANAAQALASSAKGKGMELVLYTKTGMGDGQQANNPWLQEFPDPITRTSWDNYLTISKADADASGLVNENVANGGLNGSYANITVNGVTVSNVPVIIQPGQAKGTVGLALGYGRTEGMQQEMKTGVNAYPLYQNFSAVQEVTIEKASG
jgi:molybdopterin-containing oxidoreductase family iron-sulfur binding subunit